MSATAETQLFAEYFKGFGVGVSSSPLTYPPVISVPGRLYPVMEYHLEDIRYIVQREMRARISFETKQFLQNEINFYNEYSQSASVNRSDSYLESILFPTTTRHEEFPYELFEALIAYIILRRPPGAILVFLPGWTEISTLMTRLQGEDVYRVGYRDRNKVRVFPLHSSVPMADQQDVFEVLANGTRKIILSTNIAETSVTVITNNIKSFEF